MTLLAMMWLVLLPLEATIRTAVWPAIARDCVSGIAIDAMVQMAMQSGHETHPYFCFAQ